MFIEITDSYNTKVSINVKHIVLFEGEDGGCKIYLSIKDSGNIPIIKYSKESYADILGMIEKSY